MKCNTGAPATNLNDELKRETMNVAMQLLFSRRFGTDTPKDFKELREAVEYFFENLVQVRTSFCNRFTCFINCSKRDMM